MFRHVLTMVVVGLTFSACERKPSAPVMPQAVASPVPAGVPGAVLGPEVRARVNGVEITGLEVAARLAGREATAAQQQQTLDAVVLEELQAQRAVELGYQVEGDDGGVGDAKAKDRRRHRLAAQFRMRELLEKTQVTPDEVKQYFDAHPARVQAELQVLRLEFPTLEAATAARGAIAAGKSFDEVAAANTPGLKPDDKPWEMPVMSFAQVPPAWWDALDTLQPGQTSPVIAQPNQQFAVLKLVKRSQNPAMSFEKMKGSIEANLRSTRFPERAAQVERELRAAAKVELVGR